MHSLAHDEWDQHHNAFAEQLPPDRWSDLHTAYVLLAAVSAAAQSRQESDRLTSVERKELATAAQAAGVAAAGLEADSFGGDDRNGPGDSTRRAHRFLLRHP
jgi:hypothetical protein